MNRKREPVVDVVKPTLATCADAGFALAGEIGRRLEAVTRQWILPAPFANPGMLEMFRQRERKPAHDLVPWAGEFAGKYLTHAVQVWRLTRAAALVLNCYGMTINPCCLSPVGLRCEHRENPVGIDESTPRLSWLAIGLRLPYSVFNEAQAGRPAKIELPTSWSLSDAIRIL